MAKKYLPQEELIAQAVAQATKEFELKQKQREENIVSLGCTVISKETVKGSPIVDKQSGQQKINLQSGEVMCYPDKYKATFQFVGGSITQEINEDKFEQLQELQKYYCIGYLGEVKRFGNELIAVS